MHAPVPGRSASRAGPLLINDLIEKHAFHRGWRAAVSDDAGALTYAELWDAIRAAGNGLAALGVGPGDRVAFAMNNSLTYLVLILGCFQRGAVACNLNIRLTPAEFQRFLEPIQPTLVVVDTENQGKVTELGIPVVLLPDAHAEAPVRDRLRPIWSDAREAFDVSEDDIALIIPTGGTTGVPKGAMIPHRSIWLSMQSLSGQGVFVPTDYAFATSPFFHVGVTSRCMGPLSVGARLRVGTFTPVRMIEAIREGATLIGGAVTIFERTWEHPDYAALDRSRVRHIAFGAMAAPPVFFERLLADYPNAELSHAYGATEVGGVTHMTHADIAKGRTSGVGRMVPGARIAVVDDALSPLPPGAVGELLIECPWAAVGYWGREDETAQTFTPKGVRLGDLGVFEADGWLNISGRKKEMIISGGENVFPVEVEAVLIGHPAVRAITVYGARDARWGERVEAAVVLNPDAELTLDDLVSFGRRELGGYKLPKSLRIVDDIPLTAIGKPDRRRLSAEAAT